MGYVYESTHKDRNMMMMCMCGGGISYLQGASIILYTRISVSINTRSCLHVFFTSTYTCTRPSDPTLGLSE